MNVSYVAFVMWNCRIRTFDIFYALYFHDFILYMSVVSSSVSVVVRNILGAIER